MLAIPINQIFQIFLTARHGRYVLVGRQDALRQRLERSLTRQDVLPEGGPPSGITILQFLRQTSVLDHALGGEERSCTDIHPADMAMEQIDRVDRLASYLGIEVEPTGREATALQDVVHRERRLRHVVRKLVGVPAELRVAAV